MPHALCYSCDDDGNKFLVDVSLISLLGSKWHIFNIRDDAMMSSPVLL